jgi:predicted MFS family arabinose efflux permease
MGAFVAGFLVESYGLNSMFILSGILVTIGLIIGLRYLPKGKARGKGEENL